MKVLCNKEQMFSHELAFTCVINMVKHPESTARSAKMFLDLKCWTDSVRNRERSTIRQEYIFQLYYTKMKTTKHLTSLLQCEHTLKNRAATISRHYRKKKCQQIFLLSNSRLISYDLLQEPAILRFDHKTV